MKTVFCNIQKPDMMKIACVTGNKLTGIKKELYKGKMQLVCKLNGIKMTTSEARAEMLKDVQLVTFNNNPCII